MKKTILIMLALFGMKMANSQYYYSTYGSPDNDDEKASITTLYSRIGYMAVGSHRDSPVGGFSVINMTWTNLNGAAFAGLNKSFLVVDPATGAPYNAFATDLVESPTNRNFYIVGRVDYTSGTHPFLMEMDPNGVVLFFLVYTYVNSFRFDEVQIENTNDGSGDLYMAALNLYTTGAYSIAAQRVNMNGGFVWSGIYDAFDPAGNIQSTYGRDIIESPWPSQTGNPELYIFGATNSGSTGTLNPSAMIIDGTTGLPAPAIPMFEHFYGRNAEYTAVDLSFQFGGFVTAGWYDNGPEDVLVSTMDPLGNPVGWVARVIDNTPFPNQYNAASDVKERVNTFGQFEYYTTGTIRHPNGTLMQVLKLDFAGNVVPNGEFLVTSGRNETGKSMSFDPFGQGLCAWGNTQIGTIGQTDFLAAKMYFNGEMPCLEFPKNPPFFPIVYGPINPPVVLTPAKKAIKLRTKDIVLKERMVCFANVLPTGNNARVAAPGQPDDVAGSTLAGSGAFTLKQLDRKVVISENENTSATASGDYLVSIYDLSGKKLASFKQAYAKESVVDLGTLGLNQGYYLMYVERSGDQQYKKIFVTH